MRGNFIFTSESVSCGHPDKVCDQISDAILDLYLEQDPHARVAMESLATRNKVVLAGEISSNATNITEQTIENTVRQLIRNIGYHDEGFNFETLTIDFNIVTQSPDIAVGVNHEGAGDQGIMFGYACSETDAFMPATLYYSHKILYELKQGHFPYLRPDAKSQVTLQYKDNTPTKVTSLVLSAQHTDDVSIEDLRKDLIPFLRSIFPEGWLDDAMIHINPTGRFVIGGPVGDTGLTGRKIIVDTYGGAAPHGGGAFSGKDPTKVDRSAAYMARYLAKNIVAAGLSNRCTIQLSYIIGYANVASLYVNLHGAGIVSEESVVDWIQKNINLSPRKIISYLDLNRPIYLKTASYGHFGRQPESDGHFSWERLDLVDELKKLVR